MFIGRTEEMKLLQTAAAGFGQATMIYGKRKVGKTRLIREALAAGREKYIYFECLRGSLEENLDAFVEELVRTGVFQTRLLFPGFPELFAYLNTMAIRLVVVIDEYPYLKYMSDQKKVDSIFQNVIDNRLTNIHLILSGSHVSMMRDLLEEENALYGRFRTVIRLEELNYLESSGFYPSLSPYEKAAFYSVFGGSPYVNEQLCAENSLRDNIINTILNEKSSVYLYADNILLSDYANRLNAERILYALCNGRKRYSEIEGALRMEKNGKLSRQLKLLLDMNLLKKTAPVNCLEDPKKQAYEINDNLLRFYYSYVYKNRSALQVLGAEEFYAEYVEPTIRQFVAGRFEEICRMYFSLQVKLGRRKGIRNIGRYYYDDPKSRTNGEFDVALLMKDGVGIYEAKYMQRPLDRHFIHNETEQIMAIQGIPVCEIGFISVNGFEEDTDIKNRIDGTELYSNMEYTDKKNRIDGTELYSNME